MQYFTLPSLIAPACSECPSQYLISFLRVIVSFLSSLLLFTYTVIKKKSFPSSAIRTNGAWATSGGRSLPVCPKGGKEELACYFMIIVRLLAKPSGVFGLTGGGLLWLQSLLAIGLLKGYWDGLGRRLSTKTTMNQQDSKGNFIDIILGESVLSCQGWLFDWID